MQAMILAAGFGTRLLPYTKLLPKPLFPLLNEPLLLLIIRRLQAAGFDHIIVNCHYLREQIVAALAELPEVIIQEEEIVLGTGGGLHMALPHMRQEPLLVTNADIYHMVDFRELYQAHDSKDFDVTMAMHDYPRFNTVNVEGDRVTGFEAEENDHLMAFTGLHVLNPEILEEIPGNLEYSIIDRYRTLLREGGKIQALHVNGCFWTDMGTVDDYLSLHGKLLQNRIPIWDEFPRVPETTFLVDAQAETGQQIDLQDWVCIGHSHLGESVHLQRCVVWDGARVEEAGEYIDALLIPELKS
ncbi:MAG: NTP transferase domain-containing protein [Desulfocapsa sp.]|nr:NTP transferase domain-containing protein [Desulfocapsa sp.]